MKQTEVLTRVSHINVWVHELQESTQLYLQIDLLYLYEEEVTLDSDGTGQEALAVGTLADPGRHLGPWPYPKA